MVDQVIRSYNIVLIAVSISIAVYYYNGHVEKEKRIVNTWLVENNLAMYKDLFEQNDLMLLEKVAHLSTVDIRKLITQTLESAVSQETHIKRLANHAKSLKEKLAFQNWLQDNMLEDLESIFYEYSINSLDDVHRNLHKLTSDARLISAYLAFSFLEPGTAESSKYKGMPFVFWTVSKISKLIQCAIVAFFTALCSLLVAIFYFAITVLLIIIFVALTYLLVNQRHERHFVILIFIYFVVNWYVTHWFARSLKSIFIALSSVLQELLTLFAPVVIARMLYLLSLPYWNGIFYRLPNISMRSYTTLSRKLLSASLALYRRTNLDTRGEGWLSRVFGDYFDANRCSLSWNLPIEDAIVDIDAILTIRFFRNNGLMYEVEIFRFFEAHVFLGETVVESVITFGEDKNAVLINFIPIVPGDYKIRIFTNGVDIGPYHRYFKPACLDPKKSLLSWDTDDAVVGILSLLNVEFFKNNGLKYSTSLLENLRVEVFIERAMVESKVVYEKEENAVSIHFTPIKSGVYKISILANGELIGPSERYFKPGCLDPSKSNLVIASSLLVFEKDISEVLILEERDKYGNTCLLGFEELHEYEFDICECTSGAKVTPVVGFLNADENDARNRVVVSMGQSGHYRADLFYKKNIISDNLFFLVLSPDEMAEANKNISSSSWIWNLWYEAYIIKDEQVQSEPGLPTNSSNPDCKEKKVFCYISSKSLSVKEYWLKIFPKKLFTFRINPTVKITMLNNVSNSGLEGFNIESLSGKCVKLFCKKRNILVATFVKLLLKNIGGSECFEEKKRYFYNEVKKLHPLKANMTTAVTVKRENILDNTWSAVKSFSPGDWWRKFEITFEGEPGLDYGGLSREWVQVVSRELFHSSTLFRRFDVDNLQGLIHPNPHRNEKYKKLKYFKLAGLFIGKCLIECSCDQSRQQYVKARFTRSFLSQILGLGAYWKHFETDDKGYFTGKIKYIIENDPECLDIYFTEDVYDNNNHLIKTFELKSYGANIVVDETNKFEYIQRLAEYRLGELVKDEVGAFLKGLHTLIPDGLLALFNENELELLFCGMDTISLSDFKANHIKDYNAHFENVISWFWTVLSSFSQEELSRLLQFTTGCSQLPPEGFAGLNPKFKITSSWGTDALPMAHTCFNQLCLPSYSSIEELKRKLLIAINEGTEGFGLA